MLSPLQGFVTTLALTHRALPNANADTPLGLNLMTLLYGVEQK